MAEDVRDSVLNDGVLNDKVSINKALMDAVIELAVEAGAAILKVYEQDDFVVNTKDDDSPLTAADLAAHRVLAGGLRRLTPNIPVLSEEAEVPDFAERATWQRYWIIDPLDGTKEFVKRSGEFTVNVALIENQVPVLGVVYVPVTQLTYCGLAGVGAWRRDSESTLAITTRSMSGRGASAAQPVSVVASRSHGADMVDQWLSALEQRVDHVALCNMGSSLKLCLVAEGVADVYPRLAPTCEWDTAAAQAVVEAAGGQVVTGDMSPLRYNTKAEMLNPYFYVLGDTAYAWDDIITT
ncbi:MAG: 3'(2'),5'-bisphosphate nucleotidase CysQ [Porticoccaceae bacterium]